ncbi:MAG: YdcF family protein [Campylobacteraceae bacterium]|nr:YdcF family protein [Campylobacteraceae bacterium]
MSLLIVFIGVFLCFLFNYFKWNKTKNILSIFIIIIVILVGVGIAPKYLLTKLQSSYDNKIKVNWLNNNGIILLGAGTQKVKNGIEATFFSYGRIYETVRLYNNCIKYSDKCNIIVSGGDAFKNGESEATVYKKHLIDIGVNKKNIIEESKSMNTWQNAQFTSKIIKSALYDRVVLVSSGIHIKRSELYFSHFGISTIPIRSDYMAAKISIIPLSYNFAVMDFAIHEYIGFYRYNFYNFMNWNLKLVNAGES